MNITDGHTYVISLKVILSKMAETAILLTVFVFVMCAILSTFISLRESVKGV